MDLKSEIDMVQKEKSLLEEKMLELNDLNGVVTGQLQEYQQLNCDVENEKLKLLSKIRTLEQSIIQNPVQEIFEAFGKETLREVSACPEPILGKTEIAQLEMTSDEQQGLYMENEGIEIIDGDQDLIRPSVHSKIEELERNFNDVKKQLQEEIVKNASLNERLLNLHEEKNNTDVRCSELKQALEEFISSTDTRDLHVNLIEASPTDERKEMGATIQGTMFQNYDNVFIIIIVYYIIIMYS